MDVASWLRSLGLGKYEALFRENDIDETVLPNLTAEDLKELGVASLGHRRKLLDAISALRADASGKAPSADIATASNAPSAPPEDRAERRQVTVMFSDLSALQRSRPAWTRRICMRSFRPTRSASCPGQPMHFCSGVDLSNATGHVRPGARVAANC
jgi:hypothetical protein